MGPSLQILFLKPAGGLLFFVALIFCAFWSWWTYRTKMTYPSRLRRILILLRITGLTALLILFFQLTLHTQTRRPVPPLLGILWDGSRSMEIVEEGQSRSQALLSLYRSEALRAASRRFSVRHFLFSDRVDSIPEEKPEALHFSGEATDLAKALHAVFKRLQGKSVAGLVVVSDGRITRGEDPVRTAQREGIPIFTVRVGRPTGKPDLVLDGIVCDSVAYLDRPFPIEVALHGRDLTGESIEVRLETDAGPIGLQKTSLPTGSSEKRLRFSYLADRVGWLRLRASVSPISGEEMTDNNAREVWIRVKQRQIRVAVLAGAPDPNIGFIRRNLTGQAGIEPIFRTFGKAGGFYEGGPLSPGDLDAVDVFLFHDFPPVGLPEPFWEPVKQAFAEKKPMLFWAGRDIDLVRLTRLSDAFPVRAAFKAFRPARIRLTPAGETHALTRISPSFSANLARWSDLPTIQALWTGIRLHPEAKSLIEAVESGRAEPWLVVRDHPTWRSAVWLGTGLAQWDLRMRGIGHPGLAGEVILQALPWLSQQAPSRPVRVKMERRVYPAGAEISATLEITDALTRPVSSAKAFGRVETGQLAPEPIIWSPSGPGLFTTRFRLLSPGTYRLITWAEEEGRSLGADTSHFSVDRFSTEFLDTRPDFELLTRLAQATGGRCVSPDSLPMVLETLEDRPEIEEVTKIYALGESPWLYLMIFVCLALEWGLRRRFGLV